MAKGQAESIVEGREGFQSREAARQKALKTQAKALDSWYELAGDMNHPKGPKIIAVVRTENGVNRQYVGRVKEKADWYAKMKNEGKFKLPSFA